MKTDQTDYMLLSLISQSKSPVGCGTLGELMQLNGQQISAATIGRKLKSFDVRGYTEKTSNKGRVLTDRGIEVLHAAQDNMQRQKLRMAAVEATAVTTMEQLEEMLAVRKCLEVETARQAAIYATDEDKEMLKNALKAHKECVMLGNDPTDTAFEFHRVIADISHNRLLRRLIRLIVYEENQLETRLETLLTRERGRSYTVDHEEIANAILASNPVQAGALMDAHIQRLITAIQEQQGK